MTITTTTDAPLILKWSEATLVLHTDRSVYLLTIGRSSSHLTCLRGTFEGVVEQRNVAAITSHGVDLWPSLREQWHLAAAEQTGQASYKAMRLLYDQRVNFAGICEVSNVVRAYWVLNPKHALTTRYTGVQVTIPWARGERTVTFMRSKCIACEEVVDLITDDYAPVRINGDSRFGYEPIHTGCDAEPAPVTD